MDHLRTFTEYVDLLSDNPNDTQTINVLIDQSNEIKAILDGANFYSFKHMSKLHTSLNSITKQVFDLAYSCRSGINSKEQMDDIKYINNNFKDILRYFDEIRFNISSNKLENDYLFRKQVEVSNEINKKVELIHKRLSKQ
jgi:hypothetical protein